MNYTEIIIINPITLYSIDKLFDDLLNCDTLNTLINTGEHNFESIEVIKEMKRRFTKENELLDKFRKIAFLHPPEFVNESYDTQRYNYFTCREDAVKWLQN